MTNRKVGLKVVCDNGKEKEVFFTSKEAFRSLQRWGDKNSEKMFTLFYKVTNELEDYLQFICQKAKI